MPLRATPNHPSHPPPPPPSNPPAVRAGPSTITPSLMNSRHNRSQKEDFLDSDDDDDDDSDQVTYLPLPDSLASLSTSPHKGLPRPSPAEDLTSGRCMTCNSTVRWPKHLKVFRCTECLTVNDLEACRESVEANHGGSNAKDGRGTAPSISRKALPVSIERTRSLLDGCLSAYLRQLLEPPGPRPGPPPPRTDKHLALGQDENLSRSPNQSSYLSEPRRPADPRSRSASASSRPGKPDGMGGAANYMKPLPPPPIQHGEGRDSQMRSRDAQNAPKSERPLRGPSRPPESDPADRQTSRPYIFRALEVYIISHFKGSDYLNASFTTGQHVPRAASESAPPRPKGESGSAPAHAHPSFEPDAKTLLVGNLAENSTWWTPETNGGASHGHPPAKDKGPATPSRAVNSRSPRINWGELAHWYHLIVTAGSLWVEKWSAMQPDELRSEEDYAKARRWDAVDLSVVDREITESRLHLHRTLLKATENLLKRPRRPLRKPEDTRFLLILLANPLIYPSNPSLALHTTPRGDTRPIDPRDPSQRVTPRDIKSPPTRHRSGGPGHHSGIVKRILGLLANLPNDCHHYLISWFSRLPVSQFEKIVDLVGGFVTYRLTRQHGRKRSQTTNEDNSLVPSFSSAAGNTAAELHAAINGWGPSKKNNDKRDQPVVYSDDWQVRAAARVMSLLFTANNSSVHRKADGPLGAAAGSSKNQPSRRGHMIPISSFYNTLLDYSDLVADFEAWESKTSKFSFCQYPFFLSIWAKIHIMEHDARRQMEVKAREAFFNSIMSRKAVSQYLVLKVRRDCLVEDSLRGVGEVVGSSQEETKKGLRIEFVGEEGIDAGGLRKEWFLLLVREIFDPYHGLFLYDEDSQFCYFNPYCFESSEQFFLVGVLLGLAIYNSTILDIALPPFAFKKLLAAAPLTSGPQPSTTRSPYKCSLDDLAEYRPALAKGLRGLLDFEGDVHETFCYDFVAHVDRYGEVVPVPLCAGGENRPVTNANRREFVDLYVHLMLDTAVTRQFEPFKRGFFTVCGGNALSLFRPEEIDLLVRGSDEPLDVASLKAVATYDNWPDPRPESTPTVRWFWDIFETSRPAAQRQILSFITGSDRIPAMGATSLTIRVSCLGDDTARYPTARTCFNMLGLYRYRSRGELEGKLWEAVVCSEGFGLK
ncbi:ubiquitin-protein ligase [Aspergillus campestris IBT 28561]|uniref:HECT-type E3 ubiquitin transferase n=1 Tax=Aspergillus campestris (strain IBT 28561) TaxID=1392248 RepID=A0A2I1D3B6_ASPC2|nr:ubiquitin-protein ligase [Aspergillus campestris IBT 28561]PKY04369.1 ubiquitin-protein ligase [Aspergillus campestris IBT 28561]